MTRYLEAFSWPHSISHFLQTVVTERPLLNVCSGREPFGDITTDLYEPADVRSSWTQLPFARDSFAAVFADPPWDGSYKTDAALFIKEALRIAPVTYLMSPWTYGGKPAQITKIWVRQLPGIHNTICLTRYTRHPQEEIQWIAGSNT